MILVKKNASVFDYWQLLKPRVMSLVIFTAFSGMFMAPGKISFLKGFLGILFIAIGSGASGCLNMWYERESDKLMARTKLRPIASGIIDADSALMFGSVLGISSVILMLIYVNTTSALLLAFTILFYVFFYTIYLKQNTPQNIVIGGVAGALPPVIGWSCVSNITLEPILLFMIIFLWTPAHFWALSLNYMQEYKNAKIPIMPNIIGIEKTKKLILLYSLLTVISATTPFFVNMVGLFYLFVSIFFGIGFIYLSINLIKSSDLKDGIKVFAYSILYLFLVFASLIVDKKEIYG